MTTNHRTVEDITDDEWLLIDAVARSSDVSDIARQLADILESLKPKPAKVGEFAEDDEGHLWIVTSIVEGEYHALSETGSGHISGTGFLMWHVGPEDLETRKQMLSWVGR